MKSDNIPHSIRDSRINIMVESANVSFISGLLKKKEIQEILNPWTSIPITAPN